MKHTLLSTAALALFGLSAAAQAPANPPQPPSNAPARHPSTRHEAFAAADPANRFHARKRFGKNVMWWRNPGLIERLSITADQQKRMDDIFQQSKLQLIDLKATLEKDEVILRPMLAANPPDTNKVLAQIDKVAAARAELEKANARMLLSIRGVLTPDQWTKLQQERARARRMANRRPGAMHRGDPHRAEGNFGHQPPPQQ
ncbi:MAG: Spy/CpxP family protein refolding chaperone [Acidobacteriaceae bacterium]|nr:Spy/CpxP family protein refolding chaperone [Acidobacteriaceae bacterium]